MMCGVMAGIMMGLQGLSGVMQAQGQKAQGDAEAAAYKAQAVASERNARMAELQAEDARRRGMAEEVKSNKEFDALGGQQRAVMAANGLDASGTNSAILQDTSAQKEEEGAMIRHNANMEKWGFQNEQYQHLWDAEAKKTAAKNAKKAAKMNMFSTLLGTAASMAMTGYQMKSTGGGSNSTGSTSSTRDPLRYRSNNEASSSQNWFRSQSESPKFF